MRPLDHESGRGRECEERGFPLPARLNSPHSPTSVCDSTGRFSNCLKKILDIALSRPIIGSPDESTVTVLKQHSGDLESELRSLELLVFFDELVVREFARAAAHLLFSRWDGPFVGMQLTKLSSHGGTRQTPARGL